MKIYFLSIDGRRCFFYADESEPPDDRQDGEGPKEVAPSGWRGWLVAHLSRLQWVWDHSEARAVRWTRSLWVWMHSWAYPDEVLLSRLRSARRIELLHPAGRGDDEVRALWREYLGHRWWRHVLWATANGIVAPPALATLWILPGPNVIGYWFAYRTIHHALIVRGIRRVWRGQISLVLHGVRSLDWPVERDEKGNSHHDAIEGSAMHLDEHVAWTESDPSVIVEPGGPPPTESPPGGAGAGDGES